MTWSGLRGLVAGFAIIFLVTAMGVGCFTGDWDRGLLYCTAKNAQPHCTNKAANKSLVGFSFARGIYAKDGDPLLCHLIEHNDPYFTWDRRGHGWHNERTYSYDNCIIGRQA